MELIMDYIVPCLWAFVACVGFCVLYEIQGVTGIALTSLGGSLGWLVYLLVGNNGGETTAAAALAGMAITVYAEIMARVRKCPASSYLLIAFFPLVPGAGLYYTMENYIKGANASLMHHARETLAMAGGLALGVLLVSSLVRMITRRTARRRPRPREGT